MTTKTEKQTPDPEAAVIHSRGELDGVTPGVAVRVKMTGPTTPPYDTVGGCLDRAYRNSFTTHTVTTDGLTRDVHAAVRAIAAELNYHHQGHPHAGRHQPDGRMRQIDRDIRLEWHLRVLKLAGLDAEDVQVLHDALDLPAREPDWWDGCDRLDERNRQTRLSWTTGTDPGTGAQWRITHPDSYPVVTISATLPDGREVTGKMDLRDYVGQHVARLMDQESQQG
jgi:hypothetical protein